MTEPVNASANNRWSIPSFAIDGVIAALLVVACIAVSLVSGKDLNWDQLNYHFYIGHNFLYDRIGNDFLPANTQSYLNPLAYVPFAWMVAHNWHSSLIAAVLTIFHALNIVCAYFITMAALRKETQQTRVIALLGSVLAFLSPIFLMELGTTFADITTSALVMVSILCILHVDRSDQWGFGLALSAGLLIGFAGALKASNLVFAPALAAAVLCMHDSSGRRTLSRIALFGLGGIAGLWLTTSFWDYRISESATLAPLPQFGGAYFPQRFLPENLLEALLTPFRIMQLRSWIYIESVAPDLRFAATFALLVAVGLLALKRMRSHSNAGVVHQSNSSQRALVVCFVVALVAWIATSSNGRYGLVVTVLCGPVLAVLAYKLVSDTRWIIAGLAALISLQLIHLKNADLRWAVGNWTSSWYEQEIPLRLTREPYLFLSIGNNSNSYIAPFLHAESSFANPVGQISMELDVPHAAHLKTLLKKFRGRIRVLAQFTPTATVESITKWNRSANWVLERLGFAVDEEDCLTLRTAGSDWKPGDDYNATQPIFANVLRSCALTEIPIIENAERQRVRAVVDNVTAWCPRIFRSRYSVIEQIPGGWFANYPSSDTSLLVRDGRILLMQPRTTADINLGTLEEWERGIRPDCSAIPKRMRSIYNFD